MQKNAVHTSSGVSGDVYISAIGVLAESAALYSAAVLTYAILVAQSNMAIIWFSAVITSASVSYSEGQLNA
jgi:hypothetical protein